MKKTHPTQKGFTLVETLVSIFILLVAITGPLTFAQSGLRASFLARDQIVAFYLAQDITEVIKNLRDNQALSGSGDWLGQLGNCRPGSLNSPVRCTMDTSLSNIPTDTCSLNPDTPCPPLGFDTNIKKFGYNKDTVSKYTRTIYVTEIVDGQEAEIVVVVDWDSNFFATRRIVVQENIFNWAQNTNN